MYSDGHGRCLGALRLRFVSVRQSADISVCEVRDDERDGLALMDGAGQVLMGVYLLGGAIDGSKANGIIRDPKLELESSRFTFDLVPLSYESVDVVIGENWLLRHKAEMVCHEKVVKMPWSTKEDELRLCDIFVVCEPSKVFLRCCEVTKGRVDVEGREDVREVFQQRGSGAKRKLSRCGRNQMGNEPILALPEGADDFVVYYDARSKDLEACLEKGEGDCLLTNRWLSMKKDIASCGSKYLAYSEVEVEYQGSSGLLLQPELWVVEGLTLERCSTFGKKDKLEPSYVGTFEIFGYIGPTFLFDELRVLMPRVVKSRDEIFSRWGYCDNHDLSRLDNQSIERDRLIGIGFVLNFVKFISFTFGDKEMISVIEAVSR
ncbi:putative reverse transcriptase domain-containing protein [Tanacetum coccineum]